MDAGRLLERLDAVRPRGPGRWTARCPAHDDRSPSLAVAEGERGILIRCWAGCRVQDITAAIGLTVRDLFYSQTQDPRAWKEAQWKRRVERDRCEAIRYVHGLTIDVRREAEGVIASAHNPGLIGWSTEYQDRVIDLVADAYHVLFAEKVEHGEWPV